MTDIPSPSPMEFDTWIYAMEAYRANIAGEESPLEDAFGKAFYANKRTGLSLNKAFNRAITDAEANFTGEDHALYDTMQSLMLEFYNVIMGNQNPYSNLFRVWVMHDGGAKWLTPDAYKNTDGSPKDLDQLRIEISRDVGERMLTRHQELCEEEPDLFKHPHSVQMDENDGKPFYLVQTEDGQHTPITEDQLVALVRKENGPHVVMTGNHCWLEEIAPDVTMATQDIERLVQYATGNVDAEKLDRVRDEKALIPMHKNEGFAFADGSGALDQLTQRDSLLVTLCYTKENNFLNLAALFERLADIRTHVDAPLEDTFERGSPASQQWVSTVLKIAAMNPDDVQMPNGEGKPNFTKDGKPIELRPDAPERIKDLICYAFSQGGNSMRDAMRLLVHTLHSEQVTPPEGKERVAFGREFLPNIAMAVAGLNETPMLEYYADSGAHVALITKNGDKIAPAHPDAMQNTTRVNPLLVIDGNVHHPAHIVTAILRDIRTRARMMSHFAPLVGSASVATVDFGKGGGLEFELGPTTHESDFNIAKDSFLAELKAHGIEASIKPTGTSELGRKAYELNADGLFTNKKTFNTIASVIARHDVAKPQQMVFNEIGLLALRVLEKQVAQGEDMHEVGSKIDKLYKGMNQRGRITREEIHDILGVNGTPAAGSDAPRAPGTAALQDITASPMIEEQPQLAM